MIRKLTLPLLLSLMCVGLTACSETVSRKALAVGELCGNSATPRPAASALPLTVFDRPISGYALSVVNSPVVAQNEVAEREEAHFEIGIGGCGGAYFLASPGELVLDVYKRDRHRTGRTTQLRAILFGPDRQVLDEAVIDDDGLPRGSGLGPLRQVRLSTDVQQPGIYGLNITVSQDRYGDEIVWGFRTNCSHYMIETSRGHRDERRQEPIVLLNPGLPGKVCFVPRRGSFGIELSNLPADVSEVPVYNATGTLVHTLSADGKGRAAHTFPADDRRDDAPWWLEFTSQQATIHIDGVTRWEANDRYANLPCWTNDPSAYFPLLQYRWLLTPYRRTAYGRPGDQDELQFRVHNNSEHKADIRLELEFPSQEWPVQLSTAHVDVAAKGSTMVAAIYTVPAAGVKQVCRIRAAPSNCPEFTTYSTLTVVGGEPAAARPLEMPIQLHPYRHENEQFGYLPDYPVENQPYFDLNNRPSVRAGGGIATLDGGRWLTSHIDRSVRYGSGETRDGQTVRMSSSKIAFDDDNDMYTIGTTGRQAVLLHSRDHGRNFAAYAIPGRLGRPCAFDIAQFSGHNKPTGVPPLVRYTRTASDPNLRWRRVNDLDLILPRKTEAGIEFDDPISISKQCIGISSHSGIPSTVVAYGTKVHVAWGEATEPKQDVPGVPTYVATYDRERGELSKPALVGYGPPANDVHNTPSITVDSRGFLHVLAGTHGQPFPYARSLEPNDAGSGWTESEPVGDERQTYVGFACGADDTLHLVYRMWRSGVEPHPLSHHATLAYQRKRPGQPWEKPRVLIIAPFSEYSIFYHRLTIDRTGRMFLSYDYWSTYWFYRTDHFGDRRALLMSPDGGDAWKLVEQEDLDNPVSD